MKLKDSIFYGSEQFGPVKVEKLYGTRTSIANGQ